MSLILGCDGTHKEHDAGHIIANSEEKRTIDLH